MRVWIEIALQPQGFEWFLTVTLYMRVWIEILTFSGKRDSYTVTLYMRVWIEIPDARCGHGGCIRHSLYESVD